VPRTVYVLVVVLVSALLTAASGIAFTAAKPVSAIPALYVDPNSPARIAMAADADDAAAAQIAAVPSARWFTEATPVSDITAAVSRYVGGAAEAAAMPVLVLYAIPGRDCGGFSSGGFGTAADYAAWIRGVRAGIAGRPAMVIVEPDALTGTDCLPADTQEARYTQLAGAVAQLQADHSTAVYVDGGHSRWLSATELATRLRRVGARGFSLNVSNFFTTAEEQAYGERVSALLDGATYVVDTSRNGLGAAPDGPLNWCNPPGRALGARPTTATDAPHDVADLWIKEPGQSDGECDRGDPASGAWFASYAAGLVARATDG
jgi:endoglucanase